ncbi:hypothetical protein PQX77_021979 [Marasmius sp. AFHP31]|nr:hypothetical protein PQX77_021979 [Marasmius sp. AFHP31]
MSMRQGQSNPTIATVPSIEAPMSSPMPQWPPTSHAGYAMSSADMGSLADSSTPAQQFDSSISEALPYPPHFAWDPPPDSVTERQSHDRNSRKRRMSHDHDHPDYHHDCTYGTQNHGDRNETYNRSHVFKRRKIDERTQSNAEIHNHFHFNSRERSLSASRPSTIPSASLAPHSSKDILSAPTPSPPSGLSDAQQTSTMPSRTSSTISLNSQKTLINPMPTPSSHELDALQQTEGKNWTRSQRYENLLLRCGIGFPLWRPSPRHTADGEYVLDIGDVGVLIHDHPFNTLFSVTQPRDSPANRDGIPEGVDPPCVLKPRSITINREYHLPKTVLVRPEGAISKQVLVAGDSSSEHSVINFQLSDAEGALLMLPQGGTLHTLVTTTELRERIRLHWRDWFAFAEGKVDLEEGQALYLVTGMERCSAWAMAAWDSIWSYVRDESSSLQLTVAEATGACAWAFAPARCSTQSLSSQAPNSTSGSTPFQDQETVFTRGFRIDRSDGSISSRSPTILSVRSGKERDDDHGDSNSRGSGSQDPPTSDDSPSKGPSSHPSISGDDRTGPSNSQSTSLNHLTDKAQVLELELTPNLLSDEDSCIIHPCEIINNFAFELISKTKPALLDAGCAAYSHDEDWITIVQDGSSYGTQGALAIDVIYTMPMIDWDKEILETCKASQLQSQDNVIPVMVVLGDMDNTPVSSTADTLELQPDSPAYLPDDDDNETIVWKSDMLTSDRMPVHTPSKSNDSMVTIVDSSDFACDKLPWT